MGRRLPVALLAVAAATLGLAGPASALLVWTLAGTPLVATVGQPTSFTLTATSLDLVAELGCLEVVLPSTGWTNVAPGDAAPSTGRNDWVVTANGTTIVAFTTSGGGRLETGDWVTFTFVATPTVSGISAWTNHAHQQKDCTGSEEPGIPIAVTVVPVLLPTPTPVPTASPTPRPTAPPTVAPTQRPTATARPTPETTPAPTEPGDLVATPRPTDRPSPSASATARPDGSESPEASQGAPTAEPSTGAGGAEGPAAPPGLGEGTRVVYDGGRLDLELGPLGALDRLEIWIVPAATFAGPGLVILLWIALQGVGVLAWAPAIRRLRGDEDPSSEAV